MKIPRKNFVVLQNQEVLLLKTGPAVTMRRQAEEYARLRGRVVVVDADGDFIVDLDQGVLSPIEPSSPNWPEDPRRY